MIAQGPQVRRRPGWAGLALLAVAAVLAACSSGTDEAGPDGTSPSTGTPADTTGAEGTTSLVPDPGSGSAWDIDAALAADPNCPSPVTSEDPLVVGYAADLGELGGFADGPASDMAVHLAKLVNCSGGIGGRQLRVDVADISGTPVETRAAVQQLITGGADVLLGPPFADPGFRVIQVTNGQIPVIFTGSTEPALADSTDLSFLVAFNDTQGATVAAQFSQSKGWRSAVTISAPGPYFGYLARVFAAEFTKSGGQVVDLQFNPPPGDNDFAALAQQVVANQPEVIYSGMIADQWVAFKAELEKAGAGDVSLLASDAFDATFGYQLTGNEGIYHVTHTRPGADSRVERMMTSFTTATGKPRPGTTSMVALTGDAIAVIANAYLRAGTTDPLVLGQTIATSRSVDGVTGPLSYNNAGAPTKPIYVHQVVNGEPTLAYVVGD